MEGELCSSEWTRNLRSSSSILNWFVNLMYGSFPDNLLLLRAAHLGDDEVIMRGMQQILNLAQLEA